MADLQASIDELWERRDELVAGDPETGAIIVEAVGLLDSGEARVAEVDATGAVVVHEWLKRAILLLFRHSQMATTEVGPFVYHDKIPLKTDFAAAGVRVVPGASARFGSFLDRGVIMMPSYVNIGARVGANTMVDTWATVGSCAQIGANVHLSGGVGIGGVLEPPNAVPVVIEDDCMIGSRSMVTQGAHVGRGSILAEGTLLNPGIPVIDAETGDEVGRGVVPPDCIVVQAGRRREFRGGEFSLPCALIIRRLVPGEREHINEILREAESPSADVTDLLALTADLVAVPSLSRQEAPLVDWLEGELRAVPWLVVDRVGDNVVARTQLGRARRVAIAGHTDTVPGSPDWRLDGDVLHGLGAADMKSSLAVHLELARTISDPAVDVSWIFYAREEIAAADSGLLELLEQRPDLVAADAAICGEPTDGWIEAGCQGSLRIEVTLAGERAHTARPWMGRNAVHRLGRLLGIVDAWPERRPTLDGCEYREALQAVAVGGGVAGNVVPDEATVTLNHRVAPDRSLDEAIDALRSGLAPALEVGDTFEVTDRSEPAPPGLGHPLLAGLIARNGLSVRAKLGWTDVARFAAHGIPACNLGPGDPELAHTADERVSRAAIERYHGVLGELLATAPG